MAALIARCIIAYFFLWCFDKAVDFWNENKTL